MVFQHLSARKNRLPIVILNSRSLADTLRTEVDAPFEFLVCDENNRSRSYPVYLFINLNQPQIESFSLGDRAYLRQAVLLALDELALHVPSQGHPHHAPLLLRKVLVRSLPARNGCRTAVAVASVFLVAATTRARPP